MPIKIRICRWMTAWPICFGRMTPGGKSPATRHVLRMRSLAPDQSVFAIRTHANPDAVFDPRWRKKILALLASAPSTIFIRAPAL